MPPLKLESHSSPREVKEHKSINKQKVSTYLSYNLRTMKHNISYLLTSRKLKMQS